ncbi:hypothetical protein GCM10022253_31440 [Sphingomonas endophytica]
MSLSIRNIFDGGAPYYVWLTGEDVGRGLSYTHAAALFALSAAWGSGMSDGGEAAFRHRHDGWTPLRQTVFLRALRETGCVRSACDRVGLSSTSAYRVKRRIPAFGAAWDAALAYRLPALERAAYERAVEGWLEPIVYKGEVVAHRRRYSDAMLRLLLQREDARPVPDVAKGSGGRLVTSARARAEAELLQRLAAMAKRQRARGESAAGASGQEASAER